MGSDTFYASEINRIVKEFISESGGEIVTETYLAADTDINRIEAFLKQSVVEKADAILATTVGYDSISLYSAHANTTLADAQIPIASLTTTESELIEIAPDARAGHLSVSPYFGTLKTVQNAAFVTAFQKRFGGKTMPSVYSEVGYSLVHFYANAVRLSGDTDTRPVF